MNRILCKAGDLNQCQWPVWEKASAQIQIDQHSYFRWWCAKAWKQCLAWFQNNSNQRLQPNLLQIKCNAWKPFGDQHWQDELQFLILRFFEQSAFVNNHLLCYWPTIHLLILKICPKFQVLSSQFFEVNELLNEQWAKIVRKESFPTQQKVYSQEFWYIVSGIDIQLEQSQNDNLACKKLVQRC